MKKKLILIIGFLFCINLIFASLYDTGSYGKVVSNFSENKVNNSLNYNKSFYQINKTNINSNNFNKSYLNNNTNNSFYKNCNNLTENICKNLSYCKPTYKGFWFWKRFNKCVLNKSFFKENFSQNYFKKNNTILNNKNITLNNKTIYCNLTFIKRFNWNPNSSCIKNNSFCKGKNQKFVKQSCSNYFREKSIVCSDTGIYNPSKKKCCSILRPNLCDGDFIYKNNS